MASGKATPPTSRHDQPSTRPEPKHWLEFAIFAFVVATAVATGFAAWYTRQQWLVSQDQEVRQLRAYMLPRDIDIYNDGQMNNGHLLWTLSPVWKNSGTTPTRYAEVFTQYAVINSGVEPSPINFKEIERTRPKFSIYVPIAPQGTKGSQPIYVEAPTLTQVSNGLRKFVVYATMRYRDTFNCERLTNVCYSLILPNRDWEAKDPNRENGGAIAYCHENNCADDECDAPPPRCAVEPDR